MEGMALMERRSLESSVLPALQEISKILFKHFNYDDNKPKLYWKPSFKYKLPKMTIKKADKTKIEEIMYYTNENFIIRDYLFPIIKKKLNITNLSYQLIYLIKNDYKVRQHLFKDYFDIKDKVKLGKINYIEINCECMICFEEHFINDKDKKKLILSFNCSHHNQICMNCYDKLCSRTNDNIRCPMCRSLILNFLMYEEGERIERLICKLIRHNLPELRINHIDR